MQRHPQPPADVVPLAEADPYIANTVRWRRQQRTSTAIVVPPPTTFIIEEPITDDQGRRFTPVWASTDLVEGARALDRRLARGDLLAWGREGSPWGPWRAIDPHTWGILFIEDLEQGIVRVAAPSEARLYSVIVRKTHYDVQSVPAATANGETTPATGKARKRRGPKPEIKTAIQAVFCQWAEDGESFALVVGMSQQRRRTAVGKALGLPEDEYPSRSYVQDVWKESLPELQLRQKSGKLRQIPAT